MSSNVLPFPQSSTPNPYMPPGGIPQNPLMPPGWTPPPPSPAVGFQAWASDPQNNMKVQHAMTAPDAALQPGAVQPTNAVPPAQAGAPQPFTPPGGIPQSPAAPAAQQPAAQRIASAAPALSSTPSPFSASYVTPSQAATNAAVTPPGWTPGKGLADVRQQVAGPALPPAGAIALPRPALPAQLPGTPAAPAVQSQTGADVAQLRSLQTSGPGLNKIQNPVLRGLARVGDVIGSIVAPNVAAAVPGTTQHNLLLQRQQQTNVKNDVGLAKNALDQYLQNAQIAHTQAETAAIPVNAQLKQQGAMATLAQHGLRVEMDETGTPRVVPDEESPVYQQQQMQQGLIQAHTEAFKASSDLKAAQTAFEQTKNDPTSPAYRLAWGRLQTAQQNAAAANTRAQAYQGRYLESAYNVGLNGQALPGAATIADDDGNTQVVGTGNAALAAKSQANAAQFNDVHGALDNLEASARALVAKGGSLNGPGVAAALAQPQGTLHQWLQGAGAKANLSPEERQYVQSVAAAHENIQALRKSAGGTATDSAVQKLDSMIPGVSTPDLNYLLGQTGQIRATAARLGKGATTAQGGLTVRGQQHGGPVAQAARQPIAPPGATGQVPGTDGEMHWTDGKVDLGVVK
jgi:hypothetical protein